MDPEHKMPDHTEQHKAHSEVLRDAVIGFADGLTVPFALTAGLTACVSIPQPISSHPQFPTH
jgi:hypothetical protein